MATVRTVGEDTKSCVVSLFYKYVRISDPEDVATKQRTLCESLKLTGRLRIAKEGINGTLEGNVEDMLKYKAYLDRADVLKDIDFKTSPSAGSRRAFASLEVAVVRELVSLGKTMDEIGDKSGGKHVRPKEFHELVKRSITEKSICLLDVRNFYESKIGRFEGATRPPIRNYSQFPQWVDDHIEELRAKKSGVAMYCTGGIRCETASRVLRSKGIENVYQLSGGIHRYLEAFPGTHGYFRGKNFVFDRRQVQPDVACTSLATGRCSTTTTKQSEESGRVATAAQKKAALSKKCDDDEEEEDEIAADKCTRIVGSCDKCGRPWERFRDGRTPGECRICCDICRALVLVCDDCVSSPPFYCDIHASWRVATASSILSEREALRALLKTEGYSGRKYKHKRTRLKRNIQYCEAHLRRLEEGGDTGAGVVE